MVDHVSPQKRSEIMSSIRSKNTTPEMIVRSAAHRLGLRFRLHRRDLPGSPDLVFPKWGIALFVHGCYWHRHPGCARATTPKTNVEFWTNKFEQNVARDRDVNDALVKLGWKPLVIWQCQAKNTEMAAETLSGVFFS